MQASARDWGELDATGVLKWVAARFPDDRCLVVGHSIGGQLLGLLPATVVVHRALLVAAQSGFWGLFGAPEKYLYALLWYVGIPLSTSFWGYFPARLLGLGEDLPTGVAREWSTWCRDADYIVSARHGVAREGFERFRAPILAYSLADDRIAPLPAVEALLALFVNAPVERRHVCPEAHGLQAIGHFGFFRPHCQSVLWPEAAGWLGAAQH
jgi:predicted alpha/beta hydrolase